MTTSATSSQCGNPIVTWLLRSPLQGLLSNQVMLLTVKGRATGKRYTFPVNYARDGDSLVVTSRTDRRWWRNLRGGAQVDLLLRGKELRGHAEVIEGPAAVADLLRQAPALARSLHVRLDDRLPNHPRQLERFAAQSVLVRIGDLVPLAAADQAQELKHG